MTLTHASNAIVYTYTCIVFGTWYIGEGGQVDDTNTCIERNCVHIHMHAYIHACVNRAHLERRREHRADQGGDALPGEGAHGDSLEGQGAFVLCAKRAD
jgi:hypothetical protein